MEKTILDILEIEETKDKKIIKKAYARKTRTVHPEEDPEGFQKLYDAYITAIRFTREEIVDEDSIVKASKDALLNNNVPQEANSIEKNIAKEIMNPSYEFEILYQEQRQTYQEETHWIFDRLEAMMQSEKYEAWHDDKLWQDIAKSKEFKEYKYQEEFVNTFKKYIIGNDKLLDKYLEVVYKAYGFDKCQEEYIDDFVYPMYLYLKDRLHGFLNIANLCTRRLWYFTILSGIFFWLKIDEIVVILLCSMVFVSKALFYQIPKYKKIETSSHDIYNTIRWNYVSALFQIGLQYTFCVLHFPEWNLMPITIEVLTIVVIIFSIFKNYRNPAVVEGYYQLLLLALSAWSFIIGGLEQLVVIAIVSNISLLLVYSKWLWQDKKEKMLKARIWGYLGLLRIYYGLIIGQYVLLLIKYIFN